MSTTNKSYKISLVTELDTKDVERKHAHLLRVVKHSTAEQVRAFDSVGGAVAKTNSTIPALGKSVSTLTSLYTSLAGKATIVSGVLAGVGTVTFGLAKAAADAGARYHDLSIETGLYVETLSGLDLQLRQSGTSLETLSTGMFNLQKNQAAVLGGNKQLGASFAQVGLDAKATSEDTLRQFVTGLNKLATEKERNAVGAAIMGKAYKDLRVFIKDANGDIDKIIDSSRKAGRVMSTEAAAAADEMGDRIDELTFSLSAMSRQMLTPALPAFIGALNDVTGAASDTSSGLRDIGMAIASIIDGGRIAAGVLSAIADNDIRRIPGMYRDIKKEQRGRAIDSLAGTGGAILGRSISRPSQDFDFAAGRGSSGSGKDDRASLLQQETASIEREYQAQLEIINRAQELQLISLRGATQAITQAENDRYDARMDVFDKQLALAKKQGERDAVEGEQRSAWLERQKNVQAATDNQYKIERAAAEAHADALLKLGETRDAQRIASIEAQAELRAITYEQAEEKIQAIEKAAHERRLAANYAQQKALLTLAGFAFNERGDVIENEVAQARLNVQLFDKLTNEAIQFVQEWEGALAESGRRRAQARDKDLEDMRAWAAKVREIQEGNLDQAFDIGDRKVDLLERLGANPGDITRERDARDAMREDALNGARVNEIRRARAEVDLRGKTQEEIAEINDLFRERELLENERHALALEEIQLRPVERYIATVRKYADEVGGVLSGAFGALFQEGQTFWGNMTSGFKRMALQIVQDLIQSRVSQAIRSIFNPTANTGTGGGFNLGSIFSGGNSPGGGILRSIFGGGASAGGSALSSGGAAAGNSAGSAFAGMLSGGSNVATPVSASASAAGRAAGFFGGSLGGASGSVAGAAGKLSFGSLAGSFAPMLPLLGMSLAGGLTSGSRGSSLLGSAGGLLLGGAGMAGILGASGMAGIFGGSVTAPVFGSVGAGLGPALAGLLTNPFTIAAGGALLAAAVIASRNAQRRRDETARNTAGTDIRSKLYDLIAKVRADRIDGAQALEQYQGYRAEYVQQVQALKDGKSRRHGMLWLTSDLEKQVLPKLHEAIRDQGSRKSISGLLHATFADGGGVWSKPRDGGAAHPMFGDMLGLDRFGSGLVSGSHFDRKDDRLIRVSKREVVLTPEHYAPIVPYLKARRVRGFESGGAVDEGSAQRIAQTTNAGAMPSGAGQASVPIIEMHNTFQLTVGKEWMVELVHSELKGSAARETIARAVAADISDHPARIPLAIEAAEEKFLGGRRR